MKELAENDFGNSKKRGRVIEESYIDKINQDFDGENYNYEFQVEYYISVYKFCRFFLTMLRLFENKFQDSELYIKKLKKDVNININII